MRVSRIFVDQALQVGMPSELPVAAAHHVATVLRMKAGQEITLFNGRGGQYEAEIVRAGKRGVEIMPRSFQDRECESPLSITLVQGISRGRKMDVTLQKAVELGVARIIPVLAEQGNVRLDDSGREKRRRHWHGVIISACEQCGRNRLPVLEPVLSLADVFGQLDNDDTGIILHPFAEKTLTDLGPQTGMVLLAGPEGGFSNAEIKLAHEHGFTGVRAGPRVLRTETAALAAITACQVLWGDLCR